MASAMELEEAHEMDALLDAELRPAARMSGPARIASAIGAAVLLAVGGRSAWGGMPISARGIMGASGDGGCSHDGQHCGETMCCDNPENHCYKKNEHWASCNKTCNQHMKWEDGAWAEKEEQVWDCHVLDAADNTSSNVVDGADDGEASGDGGCSNDGEHCGETMCCNNPENHCYKKNDHWASCNKTCNQHMKWEDGAWAEKEEQVWDCHVLDAADDGEIVDAADDGDNCIEVKTCKNEHSHCFLKNEHWASCNATCSQHSQWSHDSNAWEQTEEPVWNCKRLSCVNDGDDCMDSRCCKNEGSTCFKKNEHWASCNATCSSSYKWTSDGWKDQGEGEKVWDCEELRPEDHDDAPPCDVSECDGCSGEQCQYCREEKERDCCLETLCKGSQGEQVAKCKDDNLATCCEGKTGHCSSTAGETTE